MSIDPDGVPSKPAFSNWATHYETLQDLEKCWPSENLIRMFKGTYIPGMDQDFSGKKALDIGCGNGVNLVFLTTLGLTAFGTEVNRRILDEADRFLEMHSTRAILDVGTNRDIPFPDDEFDFLVSWNVIHYETSDADISEAISEYNRVLRPGGRLIMSTTGPRHKILRGATKVKDRLYLIQRDDDFRMGETLYCFETAGYLHSQLSSQFTDVLIGRSEEDLFTDKLDAFLAIGTKPFSQ